MVEHRGDTIEAEAIEAEVIHPISEIGKEEAADLFFSVVEEAGIPLRVIALMEVEAFLAIESGKAFRKVFDGVGMDNVHEDGDAESMGGVDEVAEVIGRAAAGAGGEVVRDVVAERAVVGMLRDGHELDDIVAEAGEARKDVIGEFPIGSNAVFFGGHANVGLVNAGGFDLAGRAIFPLVFRLIDDLGGEALALLILNEEMGVGRDAVVRAIGSDDVNLVKVTVFQGITWNLDFPDPRDAGADKTEGVARPIAEVTGEGEGFGPGSPFAENPMLALAMEAELMVRSGKISEGTVFGKFLLKASSSLADGIGIGLQPGIDFYETGNVVCFTHTARLAKTEPKSAGKARHSLYFSE